MRWEPRAARYSGLAGRQYGAYHPAVPDRIAELILDLPSSTVAEGDAASREIIRFDAELGGEIAPFAAILLRSESAASSQIENLSASARAIAEAELDAAQIDAVIHEFTPEAVVSLLTTLPKLGPLRITDFDPAKELWSRGPGTWWPRRNGWVSDEWWPNR